MKKKLSLFLVAFLAVFASSFAEPVEKDVTYALTEGDTFTSGQTVEVKNGTDVVATITYGEDGGEAFKAAKADKNIEGFTAFTEGNGTNGNKTGGTWYTITPKFDGTIEVAVALNADKAFYILEDGTALADYNGITVSAKYYGTYKFTAKADKSYKIYCAGSKLGFYGFKYNYAVDDDDPTPVETKTIYMRPGVWASDAEASTRYAVYAFNVSTEGNQWFDMTEVKDDEGTFTADIPENYEKIILVRMNGATTENNWDNKWNQTADIDFAQTASNTLFTIDGTSWGKENTPYTTSEYTGPEEPVEETEYTVQFVNGADWQQVYAYTWTGDGVSSEKVEQLDVWPGKPMGLIDTEAEIDGKKYPVYELKFKAAVEPANIIFSNGRGGETGVTQTADQEFVDGYQYALVINDEPVNPDQQEEEIEFTAAGTGTNPMVYTKDHFTYTFDKGSGSSSPAYVTSAEETRLYAKGTLTIKAKASEKIIASSPIVLFW